MTPAQGPSLLGEPAAPPPAAPIGRGGLPWLTLTTLFVLVVGFLVEVGTSPDPTTGALAASVDTLVLMGGTMRTLVVGDHEWWRVFLAPLLHGDLIHIALNGFALAMAGMLLESLVGRGRWLATWTVGALAGSLASLAVTKENVVSVGASGAVMALLAAVMVVAMRIEGPARSQIQVQVARLLVPSLLPIVAVRSGGNIDFGAHFGGAFAGALLGLVWLKEGALARVVGGLATAVGLGLLTTTVVAVGIAARERPSLLVELGKAKAEALGPELAAACTAGSKRACLMHAQNLIYGEPPQLEQAVAILEKPCASGDAEACFHLANAYDRSSAKPFTDEKAKALWSKACDEKLGGGCFNLALWLENQSPIDDEAVSAAYRAGCALKYGKACTGLAVAIYQLPGKAAEALETARAGCALDTKESCWLVGRFLSQGIGVELTTVTTPGYLNEAVKFHEKACTLGDVRGCNSAGVLYRDGDLGPGAVDLEKAIGLLEKACATADPLGCTNLGEALAKRPKEKRDPKREFELFDAACAGGSVAGCDDLLSAVMRADVNTEGPKYRPHLEAACEKKIATACRAVALFDEQGIGGPVNLERSTQLLEQGCAGGEALSCAWLADNLVKAPPLSRATIDRADGLYETACNAGYHDACERRAKVRAMVPAKR
ncbi:MAG: rhomboid family intramembrane serine protease [Myxococcaceae bacterium]|nr:rhomboid family intramembrane serine protease [Myxococcaceae bacterium]